MNSSVPPILDETAAQPTRRPRLKLNADLLLSERGFRYLRAHYLDIDFAGPGQELEDMDKLMLFYREWAHYLFPEARFKDFLEKTRKECSGRVMRQYLQDLRRDAQAQNADIGPDFFKPDFAEFEANLADAKSMLAKANDGGGAMGREEAEDDFDFGEFDFGQDDEDGGCSEEERLLEEMNSTSF